jgi:hypothetical protein
MEYKKIEEILENKGLKGNRGEYEKMGEIGENGGN